MKRALPASLLVISLLAAACGGASPEEIVEASESFGPTIEDVSVAAPTTTVGSEIPDDITFEEEAATVSNGASLQLPSSDVGICAAMDDVLDLFFNATQFQPLQDELSSGGRIEALFVELDDGPFGAEWNRFWAAFAEFERTGDDSALGALDDAWLQNADQLAVEQCGYPVITTFITAISPNCFDAVSEDAAPGAVTCTPQRDPR